MKAVILAILLALPPFHEDKKKLTEPQLKAYLDRQATAIDGAVAKAKKLKTWRGNSVSLAAHIITIGRLESRYSKRIADGDCRNLECDGQKLPGGFVVYRSLGSYQQQANGVITKEQWKALPGDYEAQAWVAARQLARSRRFCKGSVEGMFSMYATGKRCDWGYAPRRARYSVKIEGKLRHELKKARQRRASFALPLRFRPDPARWPTRTFLAQRHP